MAIAYLGNTISGASGDTKPTLSANEKGVIFIETDTNKIYQWDTDSWNEIVLSDASTSAKGIASFSSDNFAASSGAITIKDGGVILGTETTGNYVATVAGTSNEITVSGSTGAVTIGMPDDVTVGGDLVITGDLTVQGDTVTANTATLSIEDPLLYLAKGQASSPAYDSGFVVERGNTTNVAFIWDESADTFAAANVPANEVGTTAGNVTIDSYANLRVATLTGDVTGNVTGTASLASTVTVVDSTDTSSFIAMVDSATGSLAVKTDAGITYNAGTGMLTATGFSGPLTGNASTATALASAVTIGGTSFDGTSNIAVGLAATATALATARAINGVNFDGTAPITVTAAAGTLTGNTLASGVTASSLVSVGTLTTLTVDNIIINGATIGHTSDTDAITIASDGVVTMNQIPVFSAGINVSGGTITGTLATASQTAITGVGTITTGVWEGTTIAVNQGGTGATSLNNLITLSTHTTGDYVATITGGTGITSSGATSGEGIAHSLSVDASQTQITAVGTITTGVWNGTAIASGYIAADAITAAKIADDVINSEHYAAASIDNEHLADNAVDTAEIADNAVTLAKMAGLARGKIIYGDSSGNPAALAVGTADQVLTHNGTDVEWADAGGGGGGSFQAVADGAIPLGVPVEITSEGKVTIQGRIFQNLLFALQNNSAVEEYGSVSVAFDTSTNRGIAVYPDTASSVHYGWARGFTLDPVTGTFTVGSSAGTRFASVNSREFHVVFCDDTNKFLIFSSDITDSYKGKVVTATVDSDLAVSIGSLSAGVANPTSGGQEVTFSGNAFGDGNMSHRQSAAVYIPTLDMVCVVYATGTASLRYPMGVLCEVNGTSVTVGSVQSLSLNTNHTSVEHLSAAYDPDTDRVIIAYETGSGINYMIWRCNADKSMTNVGPAFNGSSTMFDSTGAMQNIDMTYDTTNNKVLVSYIDTGNSYPHYVIAGAVSTAASSGMTVTWGTKVNLGNVTDNYQHHRQSGLFHDSDTGKNLLVHGSFGRMKNNTVSQFGYMSINRFSLSGNNLSSDSGGSQTSTDTAHGQDGGDTGFNAGSMYYNGALQVIYVPHYKRAIALFRNDAMSDRPSLLCINSGAAGDLDLQNLAGFNGAAVSNGGTATIATQGSVNEVSGYGLTAGVKYFIANSGNLTTTDGGYGMAGIALSSTKLLIVNHAWV